ncbi:Eukaryotic translation initiation factor 3 subunit B [Bienertia sinuspersici]
MYGSDLSDQNAGILFCIIDEHGDSILERIPSFVSQGYIQNQQPEDAVISEGSRFQRGSTDEFIFWGPKLGSIQAMWIGLDSGSWRIGGATLTIFSADNYQKGKGSENGIMYSTITCEFETEDVLLGEGSDLAMTELRPCLVTEKFGADSVSIADGSAKAMSLAEKGITNEDSMREYEDLKNSLLLYDSMLILSGTCITSFTTGKNTALEFLTGGVGGFLYLLLLQRSVDTLPTPESSVTNNENQFSRLSRGVKAPIVVFLFAFAVAALSTRHDKPDIIAALTPREILAGMVGFLACKVSVVLAAFKPVSRSIKDTN